MFAKKSIFILALSLLCFIIPYSVRALPLRLTALESQEVEDPSALINHAPVLKSVGLKMYQDKKLYLNIFIDTAHEEIRYLNTISDGGVFIEVWLRTGNKGWIKCYKGDFAEDTVIVTDAGTFLGEIDSSVSTAYDIAFIYSFDNASYPASGKSDVIQSPLSNIITNNTALYSVASAWAEQEIASAEEYALIPLSIRGEDMTKSITREEFAELSICLYETTTGILASAVSPNPFTDTVNPEVLKAKQLGITEGTSSTTFSPKEPVNREQVAAMLGRAVELIAPDADFSTDGAPVFSDHNQISSWALEHVLFMSKIGVIKGADGKFMPRAVTDAQKRSGYGNTTREQAIAMSVRIYDWYRNLPIENND